MADAGAEQIRALLDAKSARLAKSYRRLATSMRKIPNREGGVPTPLAFAALDDVRAFYAELVGQISSVSTTSPAKPAVIAALAILDEGHAALGEALQIGIDKDAGDGIARRARKLTKRAAKDLKAARAGLT